MICIYAYLVIFTEKGYGVIKFQLPELQVVSFPNYWYLLYTYIYSFQPYILGTCYSYWRPLSGARCFVLQVQIEAMIFSCNRSPTSAESWYAPFFQESCSSLGVLCMMFCIGRLGPVHYICYSFEAFVDTYVQFSLVLFMALSDFHCLVQLYLWSSWPYVLEILCSCDLVGPGGLNCLRLTVSDAM